MLEECPAVSKELYCKSCYYIYLQNIISDMGRTQKIMALEVLIVCKKLRTHPIPQCLPVCSLLIGLGVSYSMEEWTWWILKNSLIVFKSRLCKQMNGVADEKVKNVAILSVRLQLEDGLCKINTTVRVAGIQELKTIYFPAKAFLY